MSQQGPSEEHVTLTSYERRQLELIERILASEDPRLPQGVPTGSGEGKTNPLWLPLIVAFVSLGALGVLLGAFLAVVLGVSGAAGAVAMHRRGVSGRPSEEQET